MDGSRRWTTAVMACVWKSVSVVLRFAFGRGDGGDVATSVGEPACAGSTSCRLYGGGVDSGLETGRGSASSSLVQVHLGCRGWGVCRLRGPLTSPCPLVLIRGLWGRRRRKDGPVRPSVGSGVVVGDWEAGQGLLPLDDALEGHLLRQREPAAVED